MARVAAIAPAPDEAFKNSSQRSDPGTWRNPAPGAGPRYKGPKKLLTEPSTRAPSWCYTKVPARAQSDHRHTGTSQGMLAILIRLGAREGYCDAFEAWLANELTVTTRTIRNAQKRLEDLKYIRIERRRFGRVNEANRYHLLEAARTPPQSTPRRRSPRRGVEKVFHPSTGSTSPDGVLPERSHSMLRRAPLDAATQPRRSAAAPSRPMREGAGVGEPLQLDIEDAIAATAARGSPGGEAQASCHTEPAPNSS